MLLDELDHIRMIDKRNMISGILGLPQQIKDTVEAMPHVDIPEAYSGCKYIVAAGMGGSGIPGDFVRTIYYDECRTPFFVHKDYCLPFYVRDHTLVIAVSYSGTTEETLDAFQEALKRKAKIFGISSGDQLLARLRENKVPHYAPPAEQTTRECLGHLLFSIIKVLERLGYIPDQDRSIAATVSLLERLSASYGPKTPFGDNEAKRIAARLHGKIPILYSSIGLTDVAGLRWKQQLNENSKVFAQLETFPDVTHNQIAAIANSSEMSRELCAVILRHQNETPGLCRRIDAAKELFEGHGIELLEHWSEGTTMMDSVLSQSYLGDFVSFYLAVLQGIDPTPTLVMSELKNRLRLTDLSPK